MKYFKLFLSFILLFCFTPILSINSYAAESSINLDCNTSIKAVLNENQITIYVTNNSNKKIGAIGIFYQQYYAGEPIEGASGEIVLQNIPIGETVSLSPFMYTPKDFDSIKLYPCKIIYDDWTIWGSSRESFEDAKALGYEFTVKNSAPNKLGALTKNNELSSFVTGIVSFILIFGIINLPLIHILRKKNEYKKTSYSAETGKSFREVYFNKGLYGEYLLRNELEKIDGYKRFVSNAYLTKKNGQTTEVDLILLHTSGIYVFESKNYSGWIFGDEKSKQWMQTLENGEKNRFHNPIYQNKLHITALKQTLELPEYVKVYSIIIFSERCEFKELNVSSVPVIHRNQVRKTVKDFSLKSPGNLSSDKIDEIYNKLYPLTLVSEETKEKHVNDIKNNLTYKKPSH